MESYNLIKDYKDDLSALIGKKINIEILEVNKSFLGKVQDINVVGNFYSIITGVLEEKDSYTISFQAPIARVRIWQNNGGNFNTNKYSVSFNKNLDGKVNMDDEISDTIFKIKSIT